MPAEAPSTTVRPVRVLAIVGSYRKGGVVDSATDAVLAAARAAGADTEKLYLVDQDIAWCTNCRTCTQTPGPGRGTCVLADGMTALLDRVDAADALVLGSPTNFGTVTAVTKRFMERLICYGYWPWRQPAPKLRPQPRIRPALIVTSSAAPAPAMRLLASTVRLLKQTARVVGGRPIDVLDIGLAAQTPEPSISRRMLRRAHRLGTRLVQRAAPPAKR